MIFLAFAFKVTFCTNLTSKAFLSDDFLSICLQSNVFVHIWCQMHFKVFWAFAFKVTKVSPMPDRHTCKLQYKIAIVDHEMSLEMWNCPSRPLDICTNIKLPLLTTRCQ